MLPKILLAGASGAVGRCLTSLLVNGGHSVFGTTRSTSKTDLIAALGAQPIVVDVFDQDGLNAAFSEVRPDVVIHQLTDLPAALAADQMADALPRNSRLRIEGTANLVQSAKAAGVRQIVAQSIAWAYAPGRVSHLEHEPLDLDAVGDRGVTVRGAAALERQVLNSMGLRGAVLRYGLLYGPGTGFDHPPTSMPLHVEAAAFAAVLAVSRDATGIFNIAEHNTEVETTKAVEELGWRPDFRLSR